MKKVLAFLGGACAAGALMAAEAPKPVPPAAKPSAPAPAGQVQPQPTITVTPTTLGMGAVPAAAPAVPAGPAGIVEIKETSWDAGNIERGGPVTHSFVIKNIGKHDLTVDAKPG